MAYDVISWTRCTDGGHRIVPGEEQLRFVRMRHFGHAKPVLQTLMSDFSVCRVTLSRPGTESVWDLYRADGRDLDLDSSMRFVNETRGATDALVLDIGPGVTAKQIEEAKALLRPPER